MSHPGEPVNGLPFLGSHLMTCSRPPPGAAVHDLRLRVQERETDRRLGRPRRRPEHVEARVDVRLVRLTAWGRPLGLGADVLQTAGAAR
jgi:hypothetical protein